MLSLCCVQRGFGALGLRVVASASAALGRGSLCWLLSEQAQILPFPRVTCPCSGSCIKEIQGCSPSLADSVLLFSTVFSQDRVWALCLYLYLLLGQWLQYIFPVLSILESSSRVFLKTLSSRSFSVKSHPSVPPNP